MGMSLWINLDYRFMPGLRFGHHLGRTKWHTCELEPPQNTHKPNAWRNVGTQLPNMSFPIPCSKSFCGVRVRRTSVPMPCCQCSWTTCMVVSSLLFLKQGEKKIKAKPNQQQQPSPSYCDLVLHERLLQKQILLEMISVEANVTHIIWSPWWESHSFPLFPSLFFFPGN